MTVVVTKKPGGVTQLFNTETGRVTYKCKAESAYMLIEAFGGIVKFNQKDAIATVTGHITSLESCDVIKKGHPDYKAALTRIIASYKDFTKNVADSYQGEIRDLENKMSSL
ncbi:MAG: hypothetical protein D9C04_00315 [Nitrosopumilus sp. B06]|nr:MAG: hypothetical protein D9C04_00315 [Nitrosopumilus sp. B06]